MSEWIASIVGIDDGDKYEPAGALVEFETSAGPSELWLPISDIPEDCRVLGTLCRLEWCRKKWTQEELNKAREAGAESASLLGLNKDSEP